MDINYNELKARFNSYDLLDYMLDRELTKIMIRLYQKKKY